MTEDYCKMLLEDFLKNSWSTIQVLVEKLTSFKEEKRNRQVSLFHYVDGKKTSVQFGDRFFLRGSVEYTNPQLTVEEVQGVIGTRLLEVCANYFNKCGLHAPDSADITQLLEVLKKPPEDYIVPFLLNTDDVESDRYSMNPLKPRRVGAPIRVASGRAVPACGCVLQQVTSSSHHVSRAEAAFRAATRAEEPASGILRLPWIEGWPPSGVCGL